MSVPEARAGGESKRRSVSVIGWTVLVGCLVAVGVFAKNGWFPSSDPVSGERTGWFGKKLPRNAASSWYPFAAPLPTPTPQLSKEYVYAGSRLLAVEDANASAVPPADLAVWRPSDGGWWVLKGSADGSGTQYTSGTWGGGSGNTADIPVPGDFDGDGKTDFTIYRPSTGSWLIYYSATSTSTALSFGASCTPPTGCDTPSAADFDGDGKTDAAVFRPDTSTGLATWYITKSSDSTWYGQQFGLASDNPAAADYDGDGRADIAVWRDSGNTFYSVDSSTNSLRSSVFGSSGSRPVCADYDGDGRANFAIRSGASWIVLNASGTATTSTTPSGDQSSDIPVQNDYDADGKVDIAVWRPANGTWYIRQSGNGQTRTVQWGQNGDTPVPAFYKH